MKFGRNSLLSLLASLVAVALISTPAHAQNARHASIDRVVAFGASLTDSGNAFIWLSEPANRDCGTRFNVPPYDALDDLLVPDGPYAKGGHHFSNGATWVEGLARSLALAGNARPALRDTGMIASNYAVGGARAVADFPCRFNLPAQVHAYVSHFPQTSADTLVVIEIGGNDVRDALEAAGSGGNPSLYIQNAIVSLSANIVQLYCHGAKKFLILNVPDVGKTPAVRSLGPAAAAAANFISIAYNTQLTGLVQQLSQMHGIDIRILDVYATLNDVVTNPAANGFSNVTDACITPDQPPFSCAKPDTYVFWDGIHPTKAMHAIVAQQALDVIFAP